MTFEDLRYYLEGHNCSFDHYEDGAYWVENQLTGDCCIVEYLDSYNETTIYHYCYELKVPCIVDGLGGYAEYFDFRRNHLSKIETDED